MNLDEHIHKEEQEIKSQSRCHTPKTVAVVIIVRFGVERVRRRQVGGIVVPRPTPDHAIRASRSIP